SHDGKSVVGELANLPRSEKHQAPSDIAVWDVATGEVTKLTNGGGDGHPDWMSALRVTWLGGSSGHAAPDPSNLPPRDTTTWSHWGGGAATIEYDLPKAGHVRVRVYDAAGKEVARPVDEWQSAGRHTTTFAFGP